MPIKDTFSYSSRWDSVGLDCYNCQHFCGPKKWPDKDKVSFCKLHKTSLEIELAKDGYKEYEWFCKDFQNVGTADENSLKHFEKIQGFLKPKVLYRLYGKDGKLVEYNMEELTPPLN